MKNKIFNLIKCTILFLIGGAAYFLIEILWRGYSHWTMFLLGGLCFLIIGAINNFLPWEMCFEAQSIIGATIITIFEFIVGVIVNIILKWNVWNYSTVPFNIMGQICLPFSLIWIVLSAVIIIVDDLVRYKIFKEEKPYYISWILNKIRGDNNEN
jgi:uncharacterized membrane protein